MKGINFNFFTPKPKLSADGSTTLDSLRAEKARLQSRLTDIPTQIAAKQNTVKNATADITWLNSLNDRRKKDWAKDNGKSVEQAVYDEQNAIVTTNAEIAALTTEKNGIPAQIDAIDKQIDALVQGESTGLSKGLTAAHAQELGQMALKAEQDQIDHDAQMQQVELQTAQATAQAEVTKAQGMDPKVKWGLIIGASLLVVVIMIYLIKRHKQALSLNASAV